MLQHSDREDTFYSCVTDTSKLGRGAALGGAQGGGIHLHPACNSTRLRKFSAACWRSISPPPLPPPATFCPSLLPQLRWENSSRVPGDMVVVFHVLLPLPREADF